ncbi:MAG TPA: DUF3551 domain-containing protein [Xanthobacteraceae bacterium]|nr:DUF3551 domain-containing protein [Xanthobacteraceae bacterium]
MRLLLLTFGILAAAVLTGGPAAAQNYPWCAHYAGFDGENCGFITFGQCMASRLGNGGFCNRNTQFAPPPGPYPSPLPPP